MRTLIVGDVHGCLDELQELLEQASWEPDTDQLIFVGDLVDRGPFSVDTVRFVQQSGAICLIGNHDEKYVRYRRALARESKKQLPSLSPEKLEIYHQLSESELDWLEQLPYYHFGPDYLVVHAGICPRRHLRRADLDSKKYRDRLTRLRLVDSEGRMLGLDQEPPDARHWSLGYDGRFGTAYYGHDPTEDAGIRLGPHARGLDTGCCFGGWLTALELPSEAVFQVKAKHQYSNFKVGEEE